MVADTIGSKRRIRGSGTGDKRPMLLVIVVAAAFELADACAPPGTGPKIAGD